MVFLNAQSLIGKKNEFNKNNQKISKRVALLLHMWVHLITISLYCSCSAPSHTPPLIHTPVFVRLVSKLDHPPACSLEPHAVLKQSCFPRQSSVIWKATGDTTSRASPQKLSLASWHCGRVPLKYYYYYNTALSKILLEIGKEIKSVL